jgi:Ca2+-binding EF-hand superfamily protein
MNVRLESGRPVAGDALHAIRRNFDLMDADEDGRLSRDEVGVLIRALGQNPTDQELRELLDDVPAHVDFHGFVNLFQAKYREPTGADVLIQAFHVFDLLDTGKLSADKFREVLTTLGEHVRDADIDAILEEAKLDENGMFDYVALAKSLCAGPRGIPTVHC